MFIHPEAKGKIRKGEDMEKAGIQSQKHAKGLALYQSRENHFYVVSE